MSTNFYGFYDFHGFMTLLTSVIYDLRLYDPMSTNFHVFHDFMTQLTSMNYDFTTLRLRDFMTSRIHDFTSLRHHEISICYTLSKISYHLIEHSV